MSKTETNYLELMKQIIASNPVLTEIANTDEQCIALMSSMEAMERGKDLLERLDAQCRSLTAENRLLHALIEASNEIENTSFSDESFPEPEERAYHQVMHDTAIEEYNRLHDFFRKVYDRMPGSPRDGKVFRLPREGA